MSGRLPHPKDTLKIISKMTLTEAVEYLVVVWNMAGQPKWKSMIDDEVSDYFSGTGVIHMHLVNRHNTEPIDKDLWKQWQEI